jgi:4,5-dihydroxyphthalate decarboxylase
LAAPLRAARISIATWDYDRVQAIKDGSVRVEGCDVTYMVMRPKESFFRLFTYQEFDVCEMSFSSYMLARTNSDFPYYALPIPLSRVFTHSGIFIRTDRGINRPQDLKGKLVGAKILIVSCWV